jgi:acetyl-CoA carboxylase biotin carboxyl carrier protein
MATNSTSGGNEVFDVRKIRRFVELMNEHELSEIDLRQGEQRIRLRRGPELMATSGATVVSGMAPVTNAAVPEAPAKGPPPTSEDPAAQYITSPMVGTFYTTATPEAAPFAKVGDQVGPETTVCIVEAMKVFNEIPAGCGGKIIAVLVENGDSVEFGQKLFKVEKAA